MISLLVLLIIFQENMAEPVIVNNPGNSEGGGYGFLLGVILLIAFVFLIIYYGLPMYRQATSAPQINVPDKVDININDTSK